jgi:excisionase family DNA binding protein
MNRIGIIEKKDAQGIMNPKSPRLLSLKQAADYLGLTPWTIRERIWAGDLPVVRFRGGRKLWLDSNDLDAFVEDNKARLS